MAIAPSLFFVAILSVYRGYFQGMQQMTPTAVSQVIEQIGKLVIGLAFAFLLIKKGELYAAAGSYSASHVPSFSRSSILSGCTTGEKEDL